MPILSLYRRCPTNRAIRPRLAGNPARSAGVTSPDRRSALGRAAPVLVALFMAAMPALLLSSCKETSMNHYEAEQISGLTVEPLDENRAVVRFSPLLETLYYCPGVTLAESDGTLLLTFVRCGIDQQCEVDIAAETTPGEPQEVTVTHNGRAIAMHSGETSVPLFPK